MVVVAASPPIHGRQVTLRLSPAQEMASEGLELQLQLCVDEARNIPGACSPRNKSRAWGWGGARVALPTAPPSSAHAMSEKTEAHKEEVTGLWSQSQSKAESQATSFPALGAFSHPLFPPICKNS